MRQIIISEEAYDALRSLAEPFVDTESSVIVRMATELKRYRESTAEAATAKPSANSESRALPDAKNGTELTQESQPGPDSYFLCNGISIPVGPLRARYGPRGHYKRELSAEVKHYGIVVDGMEYYEPSPAAIAAKLAAGASEEAASENGWRFWEYFDRSTGQWQRLEKLRRKRS